VISSTNLPWWALPLAIAIGALAYWRAVEFRRVHGVTPWRWSPWLWAFIGFLSLLLWVVLYVVAIAQTRKNLENGRYQPGGRIAPPGGEPASQFPAYPQSAMGEQVRSAPMTSPAPSAVAVPPSWHPDPSGRFDYRYWDGSDWTEHVSSNGVADIDPPPH
jgi:hypothetical protein